MQPQGVQVYGSLRLAADSRGGLVLEHDDGVAVLVSI